MNSASCRGSVFFPVFFRISLLLTFLLSACQPALSPTPLPTPEVLEVQLTAALLPLGERLQGCALDLPNTGLVLLETPTGALDLEQSGLALRWGTGSPEIEYAAAIGEEELVVVAHPNNPLQQITLEDLRAAYQGALREWPETQEEIEIWAYPSGEDVQEIFDSAIFAGNPPASGNTWLAPDPRAMLTAVAGSPAALGFLPRRWLDDSVKVLSISGVQPADLRQPILALSKSEPTGPKRAWLICLQQAPR